MSEIYKQKEWEFRSLIENTPCIPGMFEDYTKEVEDFIDKLLNDTKEINVLRHELKEYKQRNEKAVEYINEWLDGKNNDDIIIAMNSLENILQGSDK